jgi:hypothetical protein
LAVGLAIQRLLGLLLVVEEMALEKLGVLPMGLVVEGKVLAVRLVAQEMELVVTEQLEFLVLTIKVEEEVALVLMPLVQAVLMEQLTML